MMNKKRIFSLLIIAVICIFGSLSISYAASIKWDGLTRTYLIHVPPSLTKSKPVPLVIALHGGGGMGKNMIKLTPGGFDQLADQDGFIVVYPDGLGKNWNDGRSNKEVDYRAHKENVDDVGFISALIDNLINEYNVDPKRVYVTGISNGAMMTYRLGCELSEKIAAIAPVAGNIPQNLLSRCQPHKPVSVLVINNTNDPLMPYKGGDITGPYGKRKLGKVISVAESVDFWVKQNNCNTKAIVTDSDIDPKDGTRVHREIFYGGKDGTEVILYSIEGGGHTWPGGYQYFPEWLIGKTSREFDANQVIWDFFKAHTKK
ncbi:MAG: PHB depolymerase family esterase [bacterium]